MNEHSISHLLARSLRCALRRLLYRAAQIYNCLHSARRKSRLQPTEWTEFDEVLKRSSQNTDISDHLPILFVESLAIGKGLIVELGARSGESTFVLERVAKLSKSTLVSVDIADCSHVSSSPDWVSIQQDDITSGNQFEQWCEERGLAPVIQVLFIDTSHDYWHTRQEIEVWFPCLADRAKVFFHDTNGNTLYYFRKDGSMGVPGLHSDRGVMTAIEQYFGTRFAEKRNFIDYRKGWLIKHHASSNGFTILERLNETAN